MPTESRTRSPGTSSGEPATERSDLYSCGVVLGDCLHDGAAAHLRALVRRMSDADSFNRPASAKEALGELGRRAATQDQPTETLRVPVPPRP